MLTPNNSCFHNKVLRQIKDSEFNTQSVKISDLNENSHDISSFNNYSAAKINYDSFTYKDHVTFNQYKMETLKGTLNNSQTDNMKLGKNTIRRNQIKGSLKAYNNIRKIRNNVLSNSNHISHHEHSQSFSNQKKQIFHNDILENEKAYYSPHAKKYQKQIHKLNKEIFKKYLSNEKKYDKFFNVVYKYTNSPNSLFKSPKKCNQIGSLLRICRENHQSQDLALIKLKPNERDKISKQYDDKFGCVWKNLSKQIGEKVKSQVQFKWRFKKRIL